MPPHLAATASNDVPELKPVTVAHRIDKAALKNRHDHSPVQASFSGRLKLALGKHFNVKID